MVTNSKIFPGCRMGISALENDWSYSLGIRLIIQALLSGLWMAAKFFHKDSLKDIWPDSWVESGSSSSVPPPITPSSSPMSRVRLCQRWQWSSVLPLPFLNKSASVEKQVNLYFNHLPNSSYLLEGWDILRSPFLSPLPFSFHRDSRLALTHSLWRLLTWFFFFFFSRSCLWSGQVR